MKIHTVELRPGAPELHEVVLHSEHLQALARVEAERDRWIGHYNHLMEQHMPRTGDGCEKGWSRVVEARELQAQLAEAVGLLRNIEYAQNYGWEDSDTEALQAFLARHAQAGQQEAQGAQAGDEPVGTFESFEALLKNIEATWFAGADLIRSRDNAQRKEIAELRAALATQPASHAGDFQREDRYIVIKRKDLEAIERSGEASDLETHEAVRFLAEALDTLRPHLPAREYLVIESDWPEYEPTWAAIQARVEGRAALATQPAAVSDLLAIIHRDGGHYQAQHGLDKAAREAEAIVQAERANQPAEWVDPVALHPAENLYNQGFADGVSEAKRLNAVRGAEHDQ